MGIGHACAATHFLQRLEDLLRSQRIELEHILRLRLGFRQGKQEMLRRYEVVLHCAGFDLRRLQNTAEFGAELRRGAAGRFGQPSQFC